MTTTIEVARLLRTPRKRRAERDVAVRIEGERVAALGAGTGAAGKGLMAMPALANAHDHARAVKPIGLGALELPPELWLAAIMGAPRVDPYFLGAVALGAGWRGQRHVSLRAAPRRHALYR